MKLLIYLSVILREAFSTILRIFFKSSWYFLIFTLSLNASIQKLLMKLHMICFFCLFQISIIRERIILIFLLDIWYVLRGYNSFKTIFLVLYLVEIYVKCNTLSIILKYFSIIGYHLAEMVQTLTIRLIRCSSNRGQYRLLVSVRPTVQKGLSP